LGQVIKLTKTLFVEYLLLDELQTWLESSTWFATQLISFQDGSPMTFMVISRKENGATKGQILKSKELYRVIPQMKALDEHI
jgi:hypothetical protein